MKRFSQTVVQIKNASGDFKPIAALRGMSSYECAVQNGFEGTEDDWLEMMIGDGWVGKYQELEANKANKADVYTYEQVDELVGGITAKHVPVSDEVAALTGKSDVTVDDALNYSLVIGSYLAFAGNVNEDLTNAALGMNNEDNVVGVGKALAMYARFKNPTLVLSESFANLIACGKLSDFTPAVINELNNSYYLRTLFTNNEYAFDKAIIPNVNNVIFTVENPQTIKFDNANYTGVLITDPQHEKVSGLFFKYAGSGSYTDTDTITSISSFDTNGAKYMIFRVLKWHNNAGTINPTFGVVGNDGTIRILDSLYQCTGSGTDTGYWCAIEISDFTSVKLRVDAPQMNGELSAYFIIDNVMFTNFLPDYKRIAEA